MLQHLQYNWGNVPANCRRRSCDYYITVAHDAIDNPYGAAFTSVNNLKSVLRSIFTVMKKCLVMDSEHLTT